MDSSDSDLALALALCDVADAITLARFRAEDLVVETKPDLTPVTEADREVERVIRERLAAERPDDLVIGEEFGSGPDPGAAASERGRHWIVDPIDGTKNYVRGVPFWATLIALETGHEGLVGVVSAPALGRRWWAARGRGAWLADGLGGDGPRRLAVSRVASLADASLCWAGVEDWDATGRLDELIELARRCWRTRAFGDVWNYVLVAEGATDIGLDASISRWDVAAPRVIVEEAGGRFTDLTGAPRTDGGDALVTNGLLHDDVLAILGR